MRVPHLLAHFKAFEEDEVLPALTLDLPFSKTDYLQQIEQRLATKPSVTRLRVSAPTAWRNSRSFIRPTLAGCLKQGILPINAIRSIASWHQFAKHVAAGKIDFDYLEPSWDDLAAILGTEEFITVPPTLGRSTTNISRIRRNPAS